MTSNAKGSFTVETTADLKVKGRDTNGKLQVLLLCHGLDADHIADMYRFELEGRPALVVVTLDADIASLAKNGQLSMSENTPCPKCGGTNTNVVKYVDEQPDTIYCADCEGTLHVPTPADLAAPGAEDTAVPEPTVDPGTVVWVPKAEFAQIAAMDSRESIRRGEIMGVWQPDPEKPEMYCITAVFAGSGASATAQRIIQETQAKAEGMEIRIWTHAEDDGWKHSGWFVTFGDKEYVTTGETIALKAGTPPSWAVQWTNYDDESHGEVEDSVRDTLAEARALADELNDRDRKRECPGMTYTVAEWRPWVIEKADAEGEPTGIVERAYDSSELAEGVAAQLRKQFPEWTFTVRRATADDDIALTTPPVEEPGEPEMENCPDFELCPFPITQAGLEALGGAPCRKCSACEKWSILPEPTGDTIPPVIPPGELDAGTIVKDADGVFIHSDFGPLRIQKIAKLKIPWFVLQYKAGDDWENLEDERFPAQSGTSDMMKLLEAAANPPAAEEII